MRTSIIALTLLCACATAALAQAPHEAPSFAAESISVGIADGRETERSTVTLQRLAPPSKEWYVAGSDLAELLQVSRYWRTDVRKLVLRIGGDRVTFTVGARAVVSNDLTRMLRSEVLFYQGEPWIPMEFLHSVLPQISDRSIEWDAKELIIRVGGVRSNVVGYEIQGKDLATELRIRMTSPLAFRVDDSRPRRLIVKVYGGIVDPGKLALGRPNGLIESIRARQEDGAVLIDIELSELASSYQSIGSGNGSEILLRIEQEPISTIPAPVARGPHMVQTLPPEARGRKVQVRKVVLDPGHGGADTGRLGVNGLFEKDITLAIARELKRTLERRDDIEVVLTRDDDRDLGLVQRTEFANREEGDVFVSIHCNGWYDEQAHGVETYFLSPAKSEWDADVARAENAGLAAAEDLDFILWDLVQNQYIQESATLAESIQGGMTRDLRLSNRGVKQAGFRVLVGAYMPAVLVEVGFLSNVSEADQLAQNSFQRRIANALADAIIDFRERMDAVREESQ